MAIGIGISIANNRVGTSAPSLGSTIATTHYNRVIADGGVVPAGISGLTTILDLVVAAYGATSSSDFNTKVPVFLDPHYTGYKLGAGSGTTLGQAARTVYAISSTADVTQATAASQPLLLAHSGTNYYWGSSVVGNYCSTPNAAANQITGNLEIIVNATAADWGQSYGMLAAKYTTALNGNFYFCTRLTKKLEYTYSNGTTAPSKVTTVNTPFTNNTNGWLKVVHNTSTGNVSFYYSTDAITTAPLSVSWTLLESIAGTAESRLNYNTPVEIGSNATGQNALLGRIYRATISNSIGGSPVVDFNPASYSAATSQTAWTSSTGEVWTINVGSATTGYKGVLVNRTVMQSDGIDDNIIGSYSTTGYKSIYAGKLKYTNSGGGAYATLVAAGGATWYCTLFVGDQYFQNGANVGAFATAVTNKIESIGSTMNTSDVAPTWQAVKNGTLIDMATISPKNVGTGTTGWNALYLFSRGNNTQYTNVVVNTVILTGQLDTNTQLVTTSNIIKTMNLI